MKMILKYLVSPTLIIIAAVLLRLVPHEPNVAPIGAMALFGGAYLSKKQALTIPIFVMIISDLFLGFHTTVFWVYGSFLLTGVLGLLLRDKVSLTSVLWASLASSIIFYLITNFGVWFSTSLYPKTFQGLSQSYLMALPFFRNTLLGDLFYNGVFFGGYALVKSFVGNYAVSEVKTSNP